MMKVTCLTSCAAPDFSLVAGEEYELTADQIKAVGAVNLEVIGKPKPKTAQPAAAKSKAIAKGPRKAK